MIETSEEIKEMRDNWVS